MGGMADEEKTSSQRPGFVQTLREGWKSPQRRSKTSELPTKTTEVSKATKSSKTTEEAAATTPTNGAETRSAAATTAAAAGAKPPDPNLNERMEGLQGWMAEIERKQGRITFFGTVAVAIAVLAAGAALYFAIATPDSASKDDFDDLEAQVETLQKEISQATADQARLKALNSSIQSLDARLAAGEQKTAQTASEVAALKSQVAKAAATPAVTPTPTPTPAPTPTPPAGDTKP
jgi:hypothetical protein